MNAGVTARTWCPHRHPGNSWAVLLGALRAVTYSECPTTGNEDQRDTRDGHQQLAAGTSHWQVRHTLLSVPNGNGCGGYGRVACRHRKRTKPCVFRQDIAGGSSGLLDPVGNGLIEPCIATGPDRLARVSSRDRVIKLVPTGQFGLQSLATPCLDRIKVAHVNPAGRLSKCTGLCVSKTTISCAYARDLIGGSQGAVNDFRANVNRHGDGACVLAVELITLQSHIRPCHGVTDHSLLAVGVASTRHLDVGDVTC